MFWLVRFVTFNVLVTPPLLPTTTSPRASGDGDQASGATPVPLNGRVAAGMQWVLPIEREAQRGAKHADLRNGKRHDEVAALGIVPL